MLSGPKIELPDVINHHGQLTIDESVEKIDLAKTTVCEHFTLFSRECFFFSGGFDFAMIVVAGTLIATTILTENPPLLQATIALGAS